MAENKVEIVVTSRNDTRAGFESAKRDAERAGEDAGAGFVASFAKRLTTGGGFGQGESMFSSLGAFASSPGGIAAIAGAAGALLVELDALASGFAAATAGAGAFYILGHNTIQQLTQDYGQLQTAQEAVQKAQDKYTLDPTKANLKALQTAQLNLQATQAGAQQDLGSAAPAVDAFATALGKLQQAFQPVLFEVISDAFNAMTKFLPTLIPLANAFADAIGPLLVKLGQFAQSKGFNDWFKQFLALVGPSTTAIGQGLGQLIIAIGKLFTILPPKDVVNGINIFFTTLTGLVTGLQYAIEGLRYGWNYVWHNIELQFISAGQIILRAAVDMFGWIPGLGGQLRQAQASFDNWALGVTNDLNQVGNASQAARDAITGVGAAALNLPFLGGRGAAGTGSTNPASYPGGASGGKLRHLAGGGPGSGPTVVGEFGPELVDLPSGSFVHPAGSGRGGGPVVVQLQINPSGGSGLDHLFIEWLKSNIRNRGGGGKNSVQVALGQTH